METLEMDVLTMMLRAEAGIVELALLSTMATIGMSQCIAVSNLAMRKSIPTLPATATVRRSGDASAAPVNDSMQSHFATAIAGGA